MAAGRASTGAAGDEKCIFLHAKSCTLCMHAQFELASQEKGCFGRGGRGMPRDAVESGGAEEGA